MQVAVRPRRSTLGVSLAAAGVVAISPLAVSTPVASPPAIASAAVSLAAEYNPLQPWIDAFGTASAGAERIGGVFMEAPGVLLQQFLANQAGYLDELLRDPGSIGSVFNQIAANVDAAFLASTLLGYDQNTDGTLAVQSLDGWHEILRQQIPKILPAGTPAQTTDLITQVLNVLSSPLSGVAMGFAGPFISPAVALVNSLHSVVTSLAAGDLTAAVQHVIDIPANIVDGALNGANLNLDGLVPLLNQAGLLSPGTTLHNLNIQFGGLFSPGVTGFAEENIGGSIFNAVGLNTSTDMMGFPLDLEITGRAIGPLSALVSLSQIIAKAIGWSGTGNPLAVASDVQESAPTGDPEPRLLSASVSEDDVATDEVSSDEDSVVTETVSSKKTADAADDATDEVTDVADDESGEAEADDPVAEESESEAAESAEDDSADDSSADEPTKDDGADDSGAAGDATDSTE